MKKPTCRDVLMAYIKSQPVGWHNKVSLYPIAEDWSPETVGRELRKLEEEGKLKVGSYDGKYSRNLARYALPDYQEQKPRYEVVMTPDGLVAKQL